MRGRVARRWRTLMLAAAVCAVASACGSVHGRLRSERDIPECKPWIADGDPPPRRLVPADELGGVPVRLSVEEHGAGDKVRLDVFIHGVLSDARTWRFVANGVSGAHDVVLIDLPGCGGSDKPDPAVVGDDAYAPTPLARCVLAALRECLRDRPEVTRATLVGHSLGSAIVLRMLGAPELKSDFSDVIAHVDRAVLLSPLTFAIEKPDPLFEQIANLTGVEVTVAELVGILRESVAESVWTGADNPDAVPREEADRLYEILSGGVTRGPAQAMIRSAAPFDADGRCDWNRIEELEDDYANVEVPCLLVAGGRDETVSQSMAFRLRQMIPHAWLRILPRAKHSLPTERPADCVRLVREFDDAGGVGWPEFEDGRARAAPVPAPVPAPFPAPVQEPSPSPIPEPAPGG